MSKPGELRFTKEHVDDCSTMPLDYMQKKIAEEIDLQATEAEMGNVHNEWLMKAVEMRFDWLTDKADGWQFGEAGVLEACCDRLSIKKGVEIGAGDGALSAILHDMAANHFHKQVQPLSGKHEQPYLAYSSFAQICKYANRVSYEILVQNAPRLSKGLPEREDSLEEAYWER